MAGGIRRRLGYAGPTDAEFQLLRAALAPPDEAAAAWIRWRSEFDLDSAPDRSNELLAAAGASVRELLGDRDAARIEYLRRQTWARGQLILAALAGVLDVINAAGSDAILIKGASLINGVYLDPSIRPMADADVVVGPDSFEEALSALVAAGWTVRGEWTHATDVVDSEGIGTDIHRWPLFPRFCRVEERGWSERAVPDDLGGRPVRRLALPDEVIMALIHGLFTDGSSAVRWPVDVAQIADAAKRATGELELFWAGVRSSGVEIGVAPVLADGLELCVSEFALDVPDDLVDELRSQPMDPWLRFQWARRRAGAFPPMRVRRFVDLERAAGRRPSPARYAEQRRTALREHGTRRVLARRLGHVPEWGRRMLGRGR